MSPDVVSADPFVSDDYSLERRLIAEQSCVPVGGKLRHFWRAWQQIGASKKVVRWCLRGYRLPFVPDGERRATELLRPVCPPSLVPSYPPTSEKGLALAAMIDTLLQKDVIEEVPPTQFCFFNIVFLRPKPNGSWRLILDVSRLNEFLVVHKFAMDTAQVIRNSVPSDSWATSVDFSDAFHHLPIHRNYRKFLAFQVGRRRFQYCACPFGLSPIPQVFTELCLPVKVYARANWSCTVFQYIDDWLFVTASRDRTSEVTHLFIQLCIRLGLTVNLDKSHLEPSRCLVHLGVAWDFRRATVRPPTDKLQDVVSLATRIRHTSSSPQSLFESLLGKLVSLEKLVPYGRLHYRQLQRFLLASLRKHGRSFVRLRPTTATLDDLRWWSVQAPRQPPVPFRPPPPTVLVQTDASTQGWGASCDSWTLSGLWCGNELLFHINVLEMCAVENMLMQKGASLAGSVVRLLSDNVSVVFYINKQGGTHSRRLATAAERVLRLAEFFHVTLQAAHIRGEHNVLADILSRRRTVLKTEWRLGTAAFEWVSSRSPWGPPTIDLFANKFNTQLPRYFSPCPDMQAVSVDALLSPWPREVCYAFPPITLLQQVCVKLLQERPTTLLLVAPVSPVASWFPTLARWALHILPLPLDKLSLLQPHWQCLHPSPGLLSLGLYVISCPV